MISTSFDSDFSWFNDMINNKNQTSLKVFLPKIAFKVHKLYLTIMSPFLTSYSQYLLRLLPMVSDNFFLILYCCLHFLQ